jgi:hypothetical protein
MSLTCLLLLSLPGAAPPVQEWGSLKGQVVFAGDKIPENPKVNVIADRKHCLSKGPIYKDELVIDATSKGVRWVMVWLAPVDDFRNVKKDSIPIHPSLKEVPKEVVLRAPCCVFEPRMLVLRAGSTLVFRNDGAVAHALKFNGRENDPQAVLVRPDKEAKIGPLKAERGAPTTADCPIHPWMKAWVGIFPHPYVAVTDEQGRFEIKDAPAGKWRLVLWQETSGYFPFRNKNDVGVIVHIKGGKTFDVGTVKFKEVTD